MSQAATTLFSDVQTEFYAMGFDYISDNSQTTRAKRWINQAYQELCGLENWPFLRAITSGVAPITLATFSRVYTVVDPTTKNKLVEIDEDYLTDLYTDLTITGCPAWYYMTYTTGSPTLNVFPVTTDSVTVTYYQNPAALSADADVLVIPDQFIDIVCLGAARRAYIDGTDTANQYNLVKTEWADRVQTMRSQLLPKYTYQAISQWPDSSEDW